MRHTLSFTKARGRNREPVAGRHTDNCTYMAPFAALPLFPIVRLSPGGPQN